jgi:hypothetical protein
MLRAAAAVILGALGTIAAAALSAWWQPTTAQASARPSAVLAIAAVALACAIVTLLAQAGWLASALQDGPLLERAAALRRKSWNAVFQRQLNPDAPGHARPRAPSAAPAAA